MRKLIEFDPETWHALQLLGRDSMKMLQELADEAFAGLLRKHNRPVTLREALRASARRLPPTTSPPRARADGADLYLYGSYLYGSSTYPSASSSENEWGCVRLGEARGVPNSGSIS